MEYKVETNINKVQIIRMVRIAYGFGLIEAKNVCDYIFHAENGDAEFQTITNKTIFRCLDLGKLISFGIVVKNEETELYEKKVSYDLYLADNGTYMIPKEFFSDKFNNITFEKNPTGVVTMNCYKTLTLDDLAV